jgi:hypothetical protein
MARKGDLLKVAKTAKDQAEADPTPPAERGETVTSAFNIPKESYHLLRKVALARAQKRGGRPSVSNVIAELVDANRDALAREARELME